MFRSLHGYFLLAAIGVAQMAPVLAASGNSPVSVTDFGACGDDTCDDTAAINAATAYIKSYSNNGSGPGPTVRVDHLVFPQGVYKVTGPLNFTNFSGNGLVIDAAGATIDCRMSGGTACIDMLGSRWMTINYLSIYGDQAHMPKFGLQLGRTSGNSADNHMFNGLKFNGFFGTAAVYNFASETNQWNKLFIMNGNRAAGAYSLILDGGNNFGVSSAFATESASQSTNYSMIGNQFHAPSILNQSITASPIWIAGTSQTVFEACYIGAINAPQAVTINLGDTGGTPTLTLDMDCHMETETLKSIFLFTNGNNKFVDGLRYRDPFSYASTSVFKLDNGINNISITNLNVDVAAWFSGATVPIFDQPANYLVTGNISSPFAADLSTSARYSGTFCSGVSLAEYPLCSTTMSGHFGTSPSSSPPRLSNCGAGATLDPRAADSVGTITEGSGATGCTLTFNVAYPAAAPHCVISSPSGSSFTGYIPSTRTLTIINAPASGARYTYVCMASY